MYLGIGFFALLTALLAGAAMGCLLGLSASEGTYLTALVLALIGWLAGRRAAVAGQPMIYWLFTDGRAGLTGLLPLLLCSAPLFLLITAAALGAASAARTMSGRN